MKSLAERHADRAKRRADAVGIDPQTPEAYPSPHEAARADALAKLGYDPHALAGIGRDNPHSVKVSN